MEKATQRPDGAAVRDGQHVFIAGLARAGTTLLMRRFYDTGQFGALTYRDMPFVLAPGLWSKLSRRNRKNIARTERAHGDGLMVDVDSPESLDEVFWRVFSGGDYLQDDALVPHEPDDETLADFRTYIAAILQSRQGQPDRYLSKTNNSILRLSGICAAFPQALILVPFRAPLQHAKSLMRQHELFTKEQGEDKFVLQYMNWLGHHEFGLGQRPFVFGGQRPSGDPKSLAYWLEIWCGVYGALLARHQGEVTFVSYDQLCTDPSVWENLAARANLPVENTGADKLRHVARDVNDEVPADLAARAEVLHKELLAQSRN